MATARLCADNALPSPPAPWPAPRG
jgi:hypothetical protein